MTDWSTCPAVESVPGKVSGAIGCSPDTRLPVSRPFRATLAEGATDPRLHRVVRRGGRSAGEERCLEFIVAQDLRRQGR